MPQQRVQLEDELPRAAVDRHPVTVADVSAQDDLGEGSMISLERRLNAQTPNAKNQLTNRLQRT